MTLKVFDLQCELGHVFEGWFGSQDGFDSQKERGLLSCPVCNSAKVNKKLTASRINRGRSQETGLEHAAKLAGVSAAASGEQVLAAPAMEQLAKLQAQVMQQVREIVRNTENVGPRFAEEALRMHHGETQERPIRGTATQEERTALAEEGVTVLPVPDYLDDERIQ
ncbi:MAG TPA: DUF1178 domain-containing protein [Pusillimonas sp.]|nr:DUF1178 domain-containing protein [Pusillimonas sp.]